MFDFDFDDLFNSFDWDKKNYKFNRDEKDMHPYSIINNKKETIIVHNILGIDKKDLKISLNKENGNTYILIEGKSIDELTKKEYSISSRFAIDGSQLNIKNITSTMKNGLLYITIPLKQEEKTSEKINIEIK
jgi:HSP20 family protein